MLSRLRLWGPYSALALGLLLMALATDQGSKLYLMRVTRIGEIAPIQLGPWFEIVMAWNPGISYGLFAQGSMTGQYVLGTLMLTAAVGLWFWAARAANRLVAMSVALIAGGAIGNAIDRFAYGAVADFFHFFIESAGFHWYIFNIADVWIVAGVVGLLYDSFVGGHDDAAK